MAIGRPTTTPVAVPYPLERTTVVASSIDNELRQLALRARDKLGYGAASTVADQRHFTAKLVDTLTELGIQPFSEKSVAAYKRKKLRTPTVRSRAAVFACLVGVVACMVTGFAISPWAVWGSGPFLIVAFFCHEFRSKWAWESVPLHLYHGQVEPYALEMALQIQERCPKASFSVEYMREQEPQTPYPYGHVYRLDDPFLVVGLGATKYHIAVWDEVEFERTLWKRGS